MTEDEVPPLCINAYIHSLAPIVYGMLLFFYRLLIEITDELTFIDIDDIKRGLEAEEMRKRWEAAYWAAVMIQPHIKETITAEQLMRPFLPGKTEQDMIAEKEQLKQIFNLD